MKTVQHEYKITPPLETLFNELLLEAVDEELSALGNSAKQAVFAYLDKSFKIRRSEIPECIDKLMIALDQIFGPGAKLIEINIMKRLHAKVGLASSLYRPVSGDLFFDEYVAAKKCEC